MRKHGVIGNTQIIEVEKQIFVEDKEKMKEFELKLEMEKEEIKRNAEE
jgi:hypothetical protein